jgi:hypothetical protein
MFTLLTILNSKRKEPMTHAEVNSMCHEYSSLPTDSGLHEHAKYTFYLMMALQKHDNAFDVNDLLTCSLNALTEDINTLIPVAISIRYGANNNLYIRTKTHGTNHLIVHAVSILSEKLPPNVINRLVFMLRLLGSSHNVSSKDQLEGPNIDTQVIESVMGEENTPKTTIETVHKWLRSRGMDSFKDVDNVPDSIHEDDILSIYTMCDIELEDTPIPSLVDVIVSRSYSILSSYTDEDTLRLVSDDCFGTPYALLATINYLSYDAYKHFIDNGFTPSYFTINQLLVNIKYALVDKNSELANLYSQMLLASVESGVQLDLEQITLLSTKSEKLSTAIMNIYKKPMWDKICTVNVGETPKELQILGFNLGLGLDYYYREDLCEDLSILSKSDITEYKKAATLKQQIKIASTVGTVMEFTHGVPDIKCHNKTPLHKDPLEYSDVGVVFYKASDFNVYCFTSDMYEGLIDSGLNPYMNPKTGNKIPEDVIDEMTRNLKKMRSFGISSQISLTEGLEYLTKEDKITDLESDKISQTIISIAEANNVSEDELHSLTVFEMNHVLRVISMEQPYLENVTIKHRNITFLRAIYTVLKESPERATEIFDMFN